MRTPNEPTSRDLPPLGAPIRPTPPEPKSRPTDVPGISRKPDGMLETDFPRESQPRTGRTA